jgi:hypothetical protein
MVAYSVVPTTQEVEVSGLHSKAGPGQKFKTLSEKINPSKKGLRAWVKW